MKYANLLKNTHSQLLPIGRIDGVTSGLVDVIATNQKIDTKNCLCLYQISNIINYHNMTTNDIGEINKLNDYLQKIINLNDQLEKQIVFNKNKIVETKNLITKLTKLQNDDTFRYVPLTDGKIGDVEISRIVIYACDSVGQIECKCDGLHQIHIFGNNNKRINFNNTKKFSVQELIDLAYFDKIYQSVDDGTCKTRLFERCVFAKCFPHKVHAYCSPGDGG